MMHNHLIKTVLRTLDDSINTTLYDAAAKVKQAWDGSRLLNFIRCHMSYAIVRCKFIVGVQNKDFLRLHLGCGNQSFEGYVNIDRRKTSATDLVCGIKKLPYPNDSVQVIETYHVIEHLPRHDVLQVLREWHRVLSPGGKLVIECPDFDVAVGEYIAGNEKRLDNIFGLQRFPGDAHLFGYNCARLKNLLQGTGFVFIEKKEPQDYHAEHEPCLRVESIKEHK